MNRLRTPMFLSALGAVCLGVAVHPGAGMGPLGGGAVPLDGRADLQPFALALACGLAVWAALLRERKAPPLPAELLLGIGFLHGLSCHLFELPSASADPLRLQGFRGLALMTLVAGSAYLCLHLRGSLQKARFAAVLACFVAMGLVVLQLSPPPLAGAAPQSARYAALVALAVAGWALGRLGGSVTGEIAALFLLFQCRTFFVLESGGSGPLLVLACALASLFVARPPRRAPRWLAVGLGAGVPVSLVALEGHGFSGFALGAILAAAVLLGLALRGAVTLSRAATFAAAAWLLLGLLRHQLPVDCAFPAIGLLCVAVAARSRSMESA